MFVKNPEYFITIANERSISKSAEKLYLSQPYLSQYLAKLEANLGVTLLDRSHTPLRLMPAGELFLAYLESQRYLDRQLENDLRQLQEHRQQILHLGVATWRGSILLPDLLPAFSKRCPDVQVVLHEIPAPRLGELVADNVTDLCLMQIPTDATGLTYELIMQERILLVANRSHPLVQGSGSTLENPEIFDLHRLDGERLILLPPDWRMGRILYNAFDIHNLEPGQIFQTTNLTTAVNLVSEGLGFTFLPESGARRLACEQLCFFTVDDPPLTCNLAAVYKKSGFVTPAARSLIDLAKQVYSWCNRAPRPSTAP